MIKFENTEIVGLEAAIRGARNPLNSWDKSDSYYTYITNPQTDNLAKFEYFIGDADKELLLKLAKLGSVHAKYRRFINVYVDITAPLYWWKEFCTYRSGVKPGDWNGDPTDIEMNSCSTMHKIAAKEFTRDDFSCEHLISPGEDNKAAIIMNVEDTEQENFSAYLYSTDLLDVVLLMLNKNRLAYIETGDKKYWWQMIQLLPSSYNQKRTILFNYEVLSNIYKHRRGHKLDEWVDMCDWIEELPHSDIITIEGE